MLDALPLYSPAAPSPIDWADRIAFISLVREPVSDAAHRLTATVANQTEPFLARNRPLGKSGRKTHRRTTGTVLAGLLRTGLRGDAVRAQAGKAGAQWQGSPVGRQAFWQRADAMERAGLVISTPGVAYFNGGMITGKASALKCTLALLQLAADHGLIAERFAADWPMTKAAQEERAFITNEDLIGFLAVPEVGREARPGCLPPPDQLQRVEVLRQQVERFNAHLSKATVLGCVPPVLRRAFFADLRLGGRFYAVGAETFQQMRRTDRHLLRINGQAVAEVDLSAAALSIFLAVTGQPLPLDPYAHGPLAACNRDAVKQWVTQSMNMGRPARRWAEKTSAAVRKVAINGVSAAALAAYPGLAAPVSAVPADVLDRVPFDRGGWALGQWITSLEAEVMAAALDRLMAQGVTALPLHDAVLVPERDATAAQEALERAFKELLGTRPRVKVKCPVSLTL